MNGAAPNDEGPTVAGSSLQGNENQDRDYAHGDADRDEFCTLAAKLALKGFKVLDFRDGTFIVSKWNLTKPLADLRALAVFARRIGGSICLRAK